MDVQPIWLSKGGAVDSLYRNLLSLYVMQCELSATIHYTSCTVNYQLKKPSAYLLDMQVSHNFQRYYCWAQAGIYTMLEWQVHKKHIWEKKWSGGSKKDEEVYTILLTTSQGAVQV